MCPPMNWVTVFSSLFFILSSFSLFSSFFFVLYSFFLECSEKPTSKEMWLTFSEIYMFRWDAVITDAVITANVTRVKGVWGKDWKTMCGKRGLNWAGHIAKLVPFSPSLYFFVSWYLFFSSSHYRPSPLFYPVIPYHNATTSLFRKGTYPFPYPSPTPSPVAHFWENPPCDYREMLG